MNFVSVGDLSRFFTLRRANSALRSDIQKLTYEVTTGLKSDIAKHLNGDFLELDRLESGINKADAFRRTTKEAAATAAAMQTAFGAVANIAESFSVNMLSDTSLAVEHTLLTTASVADNHLSAAISALNANVGGRFVMSGARVNIPPLINADDLVGHAQSVISGASTTEEALQRLENWFDAAPGGGGFADIAYRGSHNGGTHFGIDTSTSISFEQTANGPGVRSVLLGLTLGALVSRGAFGGDQTAHPAIMRAGGGHLAKGNSLLTLARADLGSTEETIERTSVRLDSLSTSLKMERTNLISSDSYEAGSQLVQTEAAMEAVYAMTVRLSNLRSC